jgi:hypothetical protein
LPAWLLQWRANAALSWGVAKLLVMMVCLRVCSESSARVSVCVGQGQQHSRGRWVAAGVTLGP